MMMTSPDGSRHFPRIQNILLVEIARFDEKGFRADMATGRTLDISYGGLRLELDHPLPLRSVVVLTLALGKGLAQVKGTVVYLEQLDDRRCAMGIQFTDVPFKSRRLLDEHVDQAMLTRQSGPKPPDQSPTVH